MGARSISMAIQLPTLVGTNCLYVQACSQLKGATPANAPSKPSTLITRVRREGNNQYVRLLQTGDPISHIHVDLAQKTYFSGGALPRPAHKAADFQKAIAVFHGCEIDLYFRAMYVAPAASLPVSGLILAGKNRVLTKFEDAEIELSGAQLKLTNAPVDAIDWQVVSDVVFVDLIFASPATLDDTYITDSLEKTHAAFKTFVLGKGAAPRS